MDTGSSNAVPKGRPNVGLMKPFFILERFPRNVDTAKKWLHELGLKFTLMVMNGQM